MINWNPFRLWLEYRERQAIAAQHVRDVERMERSEERQAFLAANQAMASVIERAFESNKAQSEMFKSFLDGFKVTEMPKLRGFDEEADTQRYLEAHGYGLPPELEGLDKLEQFQAILDKLDTV